MSVRIGIAVVLVVLGLAGRATARDCNDNGVEDVCDLACANSGPCDVPGCGQSNDCNDNGVPDECDIAASFQGLGDLPGGVFSSVASAVSADGSVVVGAGGSSSGQEAFRWTRAEGMVGIGILPGYSTSEASGISADGSVVVGRSSIPGWVGTDQTFRWAPGTGMEGLGHLPTGGTISTLPAVSADGSIVVGGDCILLFGSFYVACAAFRWTSVDGMVGLGNLPGGAFESSEATSISGDGAVVVGNGDIGPGPCDCTGNACPFYDPFRWTMGDGMTELGIPQALCLGSLANDISTNGQVVVGGSADDPVKAFRWTPTGGTVGLGDLPGGRFYSRAWGVSDDGGAVVGDSESASGIEAFIWDALHGMRSLRAVLVDDYGVDLTGWALTSARDISGDGRTIVGYGTNPSGLTEAWVATLPFSGDCSANGVPDECDQDCDANLVADACETWIDAAVDIRPRAWPNVLGRAAHGVLPVALLGTAEFDVNDVNISSVRLRRAGCVGDSVAPDLSPHGLYTVIEDVGTPRDGAGCSRGDPRGDGRADLTIRFRIEDVVTHLLMDDGASGALVDLVLTGELNDGTPFIGSDCVRPTPF